MSKKPIRLLCFESSCDDTSVALLEAQPGDDVPRIVEFSVQSQDDVHEKYGGIVPELASRAHLKNLLPCIRKVLSKSKLSFSEIDCFAATSKPGLVGSLLIGQTAAKTLAFIHQKAFVACDHLEGHLGSVFLQHQVQFPFLSIIASGGHSSLYLVKGFDEFEKIGVTIDDAAGEAFDKGAKLLGLGFPGGPELEKLARDGSASTYSFPAVNVPGFDFSFSGIKSELVRLVNREADALNRADAAAGYQHCILNHLFSKITKALDHYAVSRLSLVGGVARNQELRSRIKNLQTQEKLTEFYVPSPELCTDNAAMIGVQAYRKFIRGELSDLTTDVSSTSRPAVKRKSNG